MATRIQEMFAMVANKVDDQKKRNEMYKIIKYIINNRNRNVPDSCNLDVVFSQYNRFHSHLKKHEQTLLHNLFVMSGHIQERDVNDVGKGGDGDDGVIVIDATSFNKVVIMVKGGKKITIEV